MDKTYSNSSGHSPETGIKDQARQEAHRLADKAKEQGRDLLADRKRATADEIGSVAEALSKTAQEMYQQEHPPPLITPYAEQAANSLKRFSNTLRERDLSVLARQTENFARRQPGVFLGGAVVAGFLLARFFKSSELHSEYDYAQPSSGGLSTSNSGATESSFASSSTGSTSTTVPPATPPPYSTAMPASSAGARPMGGASTSTTETTPANTQPKGEL